MLGKAGNVRGSSSMGQRVLKHFKAVFVGYKKCTGRRTVIRVILAGVGDGRPARLLCCCDGVPEKRSVWQWLRLLVWCCFY